MWTMRETLTDNEPQPFDSASTVERDNLANSGRDTFHHSQVDLPDE